MNEFKIAVLSGDKIELKSGRTVWKSKFKPVVVKVLNSGLMTNLDYPNVEVTGIVSDGQICELAISNTETGDYMEIDNPVLEGDVLHHKRLFFSFVSPDGNNWKMSFNNQRFECCWSEFKNSGISYEDGLNIRGEFIRTDIYSKIPLFKSFLHRMELCFSYYTVYGPQDIMDLVYEKLDISPISLKDFEIVFGRLVDVIKIRNGEMECGIRKNKDYIVRMDLLNTVTYSEKEFALAEQTEYQQHTISWKKTFHGDISVDEVKILYEKAKCEIVDLIHEVALINARRARTLAAIAKY